MTDHPDLTKMTEIRDEMNANGSPEPDNPYFAELFRSVADEVSLIEFASPLIIQSAQLLKAPGISVEELFSGLMALYADAFVTGALFERKGGTTR